MTPINKVLIVRLGAFGDIVHALPAQQLLHKRLPGVTVDWLAEPAYLSLLRCVPGIRKVWTANLKSRRSHSSAAPDLLRLVRSLRRERFDVVVDFQGLLKSALLARVAARGQVLGFRAERFKEKGTGWFYTHRQDGESDLNQHVIDANVGLVQGLVGGQHRTAVVPFRISREDEDYVRDRLAESKTPRPLLINPGAGWVTKLWPPREYGRLAALIQERLGLPVVITYGPGEEGLVEDLRQAAGPTRPAAFPTTLTQLAALCRLSRLMVAGDSGPLHLAVATGTPAVAVLGPTAAARNGPYGTADIVVKRNLPCSNSYKRVCQEFICMDIPAERVFQAVRQRLEAAGEPLRRS